MRVTGRLVPQRPGAAVAVGDITLRCYSSADFVVYQHLEYEAGLLRDITRHSDIVCWYCCRRVLLYQREQ